MQTKRNRSGGAVVEYDGKRGKVFRIKYRDADGAPGDGDARRRARRVDATEGRGRAARAARPRRAEGLPAPGAADVRRLRRTWFAEGEPGAGGSRRPSAQYRSVRGASSTASGRRARGDPAAARRRVRRRASSARAAPATDRRRPRRCCTRSSRPRSARSWSTRTRSSGAERPKVPRRNGASSSPPRSPASARRSPTSRSRGVPDARPDRRPPLRAARAPLARRRPRRGRAPRRRLEDRGGYPVDRALADAAPRSSGSSGARRIPGRRRARLLQPGAGRRVPRRRVRRGVPGRAQRPPAIEDDVRPFHDLRHTAITNDAAAGSSADRGDGEGRATRTWRPRSATCTWPASCSATRPRRSSGGCSVR